MIWLLHSYAPMLIIVLLTAIGVMTSACAVTCYLGGAFGDEFKNVTFVVEPVHNIVHADKITENNSVFVAHRLIDDTEFLASTNGWFRPVNFYIGPDGALSSPFSRDENLLGQAIAELSDIESPGRKNYFRQVGAMVAAGRNTTDIRDFVRETVEGSSQESLWWRSDALSGLADRIHEVNLEPGALSEEYDMLFLVFFESDKVELRRSVLLMLEAVGLPDGTIGWNVVRGNRYGITPGWNIEKCRRN